MKPILRPFYIFALNTNNDKESHVLLNEGLTNTQFKTLQGMYKGEKETSYLVDADFENVAVKLAEEYNQESILYVDETRDAFLLFKSGERQKLGKWQEIKNIAGLDAYTIDISTGRVYAAL
jgi:hypothetical protein